jgi:hypothetical protein
MPDLAAAVTELYAVFSRYPLREPMSNCPHCIGPDEAAELTGTPLREIPATLIGVYAENAMGETWGDWDDPKHFLPRVLELLGTGELCQFMLFEMLFTGLSIRAQDWPDDGRLALGGYLRALHRQVSVTVHDAGLFDRWSHVM